MLHAPQQHSFSPLDLTMLKLLTAEGPADGQQPRSKRSGQRRPHVDPLLVAAAASTGPDVTRNHYLHEYFPHAHAYESCDRDDGDRTTKARARVGGAARSSAHTTPASPPPPSVRYQSQQGPRSARLNHINHAQTGTPSPQPINIDAQPLAGTVSPPSLPSSSSRSPSARRLSMSDPMATKVLRASAAASPTTSPPTTAATLAGPLRSSAPAPLPPLQVKCQVRTRIPTPHGHVFLYLYSNNHDNKEHLAFVADQAQMDERDPADNVHGPADRPYIRSSSLDSTWRTGETEMERIVRGAYVGRLSANSIHVAPPSESTSAQRSDSAPEPPLVRIHSECFTGETIGSQRCDCGEQLDEAFRLITTAKRGVVVYLRQEGRGIGLLEKMRAYNLQDLGHDTVTANLMLGHGADMRTYDIAGAILRDLSVDQVRLLTNNPDKIEQIEKEGVRVVERVAMVPRAWVPSTNGPAGRKDKGKSKRRARMSGAALLHQATETLLAEQQPSVVPSSDEDQVFGDEDVEDDDDDDDEDDSSGSSEESNASLNLRRSGVGMIGAATTRSPELEKYLRTKIERMGHMLQAPAPAPAPPSSSSSSASGKPRTKASKAPKSPKASLGRPSVLRRQTTGEPHPLASSVVSFAETDTNSVECGSGCEQCNDDDEQGPDTQSSGPEGRE